MDEVFTITLRSFMNLSYLDLENSRMNSLSIKIKTKKNN